MLCSSGYSNWTMTDQTILPRPMTIDEFEPLVGEWMLADCEPDTVKIRLIDAKPLKHHDGLDRPPFILTFYTPPQVQLIDGGYVIRCGQFGPDIIHISSLIAPHGADEGYYYQAVFN
jgi:hypothetical protein